MCFRDPGSRVPGVPGSRLHTGPGIYPGHSGPGYTRARGSPHRHGSPDNPRDFELQRGNFALPKVRDVRAEELAVVRTLKKDCIDSYSYINICINIYIYICIYIYALPLVTQGSPRRRLRRPPVTKGVAPALVSVMSGSCALSHACLQSLRAGNRTFGGSKRHPPTANPLEKVRGFAPHIFQWALR
jgi:hypothetical protein